MRFAIITHVPHHFSDSRYFAYGPYVREMNIWGDFVDDIEIVAPLLDSAPGAIDLAYSHPKIAFTEIAAFNLIGFSNKLKAVFLFPIIAARIFKVMAKADHIHLRCPGNIGLIGCLVQIFFPSKPKTAKYAGNWDPSSAQPWSYRLQKYILNNTSLTKNMQVLVYGDWKGDSKNIKPFFTASYSEGDKTDVPMRSFDSGVKFLFVGSLAPGKQPMYALKLAQKIGQSGIDVKIDFYGEGKERQSLETYISENQLQQLAELKGNRNEAEVREAYKHSHFVLLPSKSEGWPKVVAEAMFWGSVAAATAVSCVPQMLADGSRGILLTGDIDRDASQILNLISNTDSYQKISINGTQWSRTYTLDRFRSEIKHLLDEKV
ncbi:glycosyltransferase [Flavobacterium sp. MAH-1]|uniref:Glycosyltransferase n=1 Tax=Flavobacterium agri TaxID=2743471 RepID=A0A7Y8Y1Y8_9FLAO|nr:glycosyltransferase [Flavobacterium agri]NUY80903.1 glycosyltransferase [Flavobacterium agri]NYA70927.1 glycosyltransferase [Flavobacterium agri]